MLPRTNAKELADLPPGDLNEFDASIFFFKRTNGLFLNYWLIYRNLQPFLKKEKICRILDIGTGVADLPIYLARKLERKQISASFTGIDTNARVVALAEGEIRRYKNISVLCCAIEDLPGTFDIAIASQMFHHLSPEEAPRFLKAAYEKIDGVMIISDLVRSKLVYWLVKSFIFLTTTNNITRHDGPISVLRCYNDSEIKLLFQEAGIKNFKIHNFLLRKFIIITKAGE